jgi:adenosylcobinamide-phosphate synthase
MAGELIDLLGPHPLALAIAVPIDLAIGDPVYRWHPVRLIGHGLRATENILRSLGADGYGGGVALFAVLALVALGVVAGAMLLSLALSVWVAWILHVFLLYSLLALGDLLHHVWRVERALIAGDLPAARSAVGQLVDRDADRLDAAACRRASIESLSENLTDGFISALFWYALLGIPGLVLFKVVSTMDSMVGFKTPKYLRFGWCGARLDDVMNYLPARLTWLLIVLVAAVVPTCSARKAFSIGLRQNALFPSPNSGWSEAATAGGIQRRLVGPVWRRGELVTELWIGDPRDPEAASHDDMRYALVLIIAAGLLAAVLTGVALLLDW